MLKAVLFTVMMVTNTHIEADKKLEQIVAVRFETLEECQKAQEIWRERMHRLLDAHISTSYFSECHEL